MIMNLWINYLFIDYQLIASDKTLTAELKRILKYLLKIKYSKFNIADFRVINKQIINNNVMNCISRTTICERFSTKKKK